MHVIVRLSAAGSDATKLIVRSGSDVCRYLPLRFVLDVRKVVLNPGYRMTAALHESFYGAAHMHMPNQKALAIFDWATLKAGFVFVAIAIATTAVQITWARLKLGATLKLTA